MLVRGLETSEGSIPSIGLGREHSWTPYNFLLHFLLLSTRPDSWPVVDSLGGATPPAGHCSL